MLKPPLRKSVAIESEEPPPVDDGAELCVLPARRAIERIVPDVVAADADRAALELERTYITCKPQNYICKRCHNQSTSFIHCHQSAAVAKQYGDLCQLMEKRSWLLLVRDCTLRLSAMTSFTQSLQRIACDEHRMWREIERAPLGEIAVSSRLEYINDICEGLRQHMNHWQFIKQRMLHDRWLKPATNEIVQELEHVRVTFARMRERAVFWTDRFIRVALKVFAHTNLESVTNDTLCDVGRGLEEFHAIVDAARDMNDPALATFALRNRQLYVDTRLRAAAPPGGGAALRSVRRLAFSDLLRAVAAERSKYAAALAYKFFVSNRELGAAVASRLPAVDWRACLGRVSPAPPRPASAPAAESSDYYSATCSNGGAGSSSSATRSLSTEMQLSSIVIDMCEDVSPLPDFGRREQGFVLKFFDVIAQCTNFIRSPESPAAGVGGGGGARRGERNGKKEKGRSVHWGDTCDPTIKVKLCQQYMDMVWHSFTAQLLLRFQQHAWGGERADHDHLGHIALLPDAVTMVLIQMLRLISAKSQSECYPSLSLNSVSIVCRRLYQVSAQAQWDTVQCEALAACASDKCQPVPLENELYGTRTGKLLRDAYAPLLSVLMQARELVTHVPATNTLHSNAQRNQELKCRELLPLLLPSLSCVLATLTLATNWSRVKATQFLSSWSLGPFLLITQTDLKMLSDVNRRLFYLGQPNVHKLHSELDQLLLGSPPPGGACNAVVLQTIRSVDVVWQQLHDGASALQMLSSTLIRLFSAACKQRATEYFQAGMPTGKVWRRKGNSDIPVTQSGYIEQAVQELLQPVVDATSKLPMEAQITALSIAVVALCEAWTAFILKERVRFSLHGASQLAVDVAYVRTWLGRLTDLDHEAMQSLQSLEIFKYLNGAVRLLLRQPCKKRGGDHRKDVSDDISLESPSSTQTVDQAVNLSTNSPVGHTSPGAEDFPDSSLDEGHYHIPNKEDWLSLRVHGGAPRWRLPTLACLNSGSDDQR